MWCRNKDRIAFHSSTTDAGRYEIMKSIFNREDMLKYREPTCWYIDLGAGFKTLMPITITLEYDISLFE